MGIVIKTSNYFFIFKDSSPKEWLDKLPIEAEERWIRIRNMFNLEENTMSKRPFIYLVSHGEGLECYGSTTTKGISCTAPVDSALEIPFIHEEAHAVALNEWGRLPSFFSEGLAYYIELRLRGRQSEGCVSKKQESLFAREYITECTDFTAFYNDSLFWSLRSRGYSMYAVASSFIHFYVSTFGWEKAHRLFHQTYKDHRYLGHFIQREWKELKSGWLEFINT